MEVGETEAMAPACARGACVAVATAPPAQSRPTP